MNSVTIIMSGVCHVEDVSFAKKQDAIDYLVNEKGCTKLDKHDIYASKELVYMLKTLEVK